MYGNITLLSGGLLIRDGRLRTNIGKVVSLDEATAAFNSAGKIKGKTIIRIPH